MDGIDWLALCRRVVAAQREVFQQYETSEERTVYEGIGSGGDRTLVIDRLCEDAAFAELERVAGETAITVISEERGEVRLGTAGSGEAESEDERPPAVWVVIDPIDGSLNARRTIPAHSFCLAVASGPAMADVDFGFVHDFGSDEEFAARRGEGAWLNGRPLRLAGPDAAVASGEMGAAKRSAMLEVVGVESADPELAIAPFGALAGRVHRLRVVGSIAITVCQVAAGRFDGMFSLRPCRSVDAAAAQLILREAGGRIELAEGGLGATGFGLDSRFPIRAAAGDAGLAVLREAQELSAGFK